MKFSWIYAAAACLVTSQAWATGPEMVTNGSFESPAYGTRGIYSGGGDGWITPTLAPVVIVNGDVEVGAHSLYGRTPYGKQYVGMDPRATGPSGGFLAVTSQIVPGFVTGQSYLLTIDAADSDGGKAPLLGVALSNEEGTHTFLKRNVSLAIGGPYGKLIQFQKLRMVFTSPLTGAITLSISNQGSDYTGIDAGSISVDNVSIVSVTPEEAAAIQADEVPRSSAFTR